MAGSLKKRDFTNQKLKQDIVKTMGNVGDFSRILIMKSQITSPVNISHLQNSCKVHL